MGAGYSPGILQHIGFFHMQIFEKHCFVGMVSKETGAASVGN